MKHYDYMCVRYERAGECIGRYRPFGWRYVRDASERGGRLSFRRDRETPEKRALDALQKVCDEAAAEADGVRMKCRAAGHIATLPVWLVGLAVICSGLNGALRGATAYAAAACALGVGIVFASVAVRRAAAALGLRVTRKRRAALGEKMSAAEREARKIRDAV